MTTLIFRNTILETISHNREIWFTSTELARALQYSNTKSISNLYKRNLDEFGQGTTTVIKSMTVTSFAPIKKRSIFKFNSA